MKRQGDYLKPDGKLPYLYEMHWMDEPNKKFNYSVPEKFIGSLKGKHVSAQDLTAPNNKLCDLIIFTSFNIERRTSNFKMNQLPTFPSCITPMGAHSSFTWGLGSSCEWQQRRICCRQFVYIGYRTASENV